MNSATESLLMTACYFGSVNRWECDENDHLNVRFYAQKMNQAIEVYLRQVADVRAGSMEIISQHIRFVREARIATPLRVECGTISVDDEGCEVLSLMHHNLTGEPVAAFISKVRVANMEPLSATTRSEIPDWAAARGLDPEGAYPAQSDLASAEANGFRTMGRGVIGDGECDQLGRLIPHHYIGRLSDGMPNLWAFMTDAEDAQARDSGEIGGAVVEYRLEFFNPLRTGDIFRQLSGVRALGNKTQHMVHMVLNETRGELTLRAEAIGLAMDLNTRKAVAISEGRRAQMRQLMLH